MERLCGNSWEWVGDRLEEPCKDKANRVPHNLGFRYARDTRTSGSVPTVY